MKDIEKIMTEKKISSVLIEDQGSIIGIIKENIRLSYWDRYCAESRCTGYASAGYFSKQNYEFPVLTVDAETSILGASYLMDQYGIRHLAVKEEDNIVGVISVRDIIRPVNLDEEPY